MDTKPILMSGLLFCLAALPLGALSASDAAPLTGPGSEKRFPPLKVPLGFKATLFACDPMVEYPSAVAAGPRAGAVFVAIDYVSGLGVDIVRRDEIRLVEDVDGDGYADKAPVYASGFNSIPGLEFHDGTLFVMHAPFRSAQRDGDGDGVAEDRRDLLSGPGLPPENSAAFALRRPNEPSRLETRRGEPTRSPGRTSKPWRGRRGAPCPTVWKNDSRPMTSLT